MRYPCTAHLFFSTLLAALLQAAPARASDDATLQVIYDIRPPLTVHDGSALGGSIGGPGLQALQMAGIHYALQEVPIRRQLSMIEAGTQPVCALGRIRTRERAGRGWFSLPLGHVRGYVAVVRRSQVINGPETLANWSGQANLRWGVQAGLHYSNDLDAMRTRAKAEVSTFNANHQHFAELLLARRIDFVVLQADEAEEILKRSQGHGDGLRVVTLQDVQGAEPRYFYCSRQVTAAQRQALDQAIAQITRTSSPAQTSAAKK